MKKLIEGIFCNGIAVGIYLYQMAVVTSHERKIPLKIDDNLYYIQDGRERMAEVIEKICK